MRSIELDEGPEHLPDVKIEIEQQPLLVRCPVKSALPYPEQIGAVAVEPVARFAAKREPGVWQARQRNVFDLLPGIALPLVREIGVVLLPAIETEWLCFGGGGLGGFVVLLVLRAGGHRERGEQYCRTDQSDCETARDAATRHAALGVQLREPR